MPDDKKAAVANASDPEQVKKAEWKDRDRRKRELEDVAFILSTQNGRRFYWRYLKKCGLFELSFRGTPEETFFREGARNIGLKLMKDLEDADPGAYQKMLEEGRKDENP